MDRPLLDHRDSSDTGSMRDGYGKGAELQIYRSEQRRRYRGLLAGAAIHLTIFLLYTILGYIAFHRVVSKAIETSDVYSPAQQAISYAPKFFDYSLSSFVGDPSPAVDKAWHDLLEYSNFRITEEEMHRIDPSGDRARQSVALPDGGFYAQLTVGHELHCLKRLYRYMYPEYYFQNITETERYHNRKHNEHCIDILRQSVMCHGDTAVTTMRWGHKQPQPMANFSAPHQCVRWDTLVEWTQERAIPRLMEPGWLKHPTLGIVYKEGFENRIGIADDN